MKVKLRILLPFSFLFVLTACNSGTSQPNSSNSSSNSLNIKVQNGTVVSNSELNARIPLIYNTDGFICSGVLLDNSTILTAAHCALDMSSGKAYNSRFTSSNLVPASKFVIILSNDLNNAVNITSTSSQTQANWNVYSVANVFVHKDAFLGANVAPNDGGFSIIDQNQINDLAILKLKSPVASFYQSVQIATSNPQIGTQEIIAGYGVNTQSSANTEAGVLRSANSVVASITSNGSYINVGGIVDSTIGYTKICQGDSGGPDLT